MDLVRIDTSKDCRGIWEIEIPKDMRPKPAKKYPKMSGLDQALTFIHQLKTAKVRHIIECHRDAIMVVVRTALTYHEIEFFANGEVVIETLGRSNGALKRTFDELMKMREFLPE
jgi:hypothetical protein